MEEGIDVTGPVPADRWDVDRYYHPDPHHQGTHCNRRAGFLENVHDFDHTFFNMSPREAANTDVQHRHLLEVTQEALDDAGIPSEKLPRNTGCYVGVGLMDHGFSMMEDAKNVNAYTHTGTAHSVAPNRICFAYDIRGPSVAIDTACAASLTAMHYACFGIWNNECPVALVGGCNTIISPEVVVGFSALGVLAADGRSCPFSNQAKGYVRSEGVGACVLKPLDQALKDGDNVYCVIKGTWLAHNGYSLSITMPSTDAQAEMMKKTYEVFGLNKNNVDFVEAHGTGTPVGDPMEAEAIARAYTIDNPDRKKPLAVGSSKSHFGHLECAAGMVQLLKVALMLKNRQIYPNIHFGEANPAIDCEAWNIYVPEKLVNFEEEKTYTIGVNTFGFGGALAHMIFEEFKPPAGYLEYNKGTAGWKIGPGKERGLKMLIPLTAKSGAALKATAKVWQEYEREEDAQEVICWQSSRRSHYSNRLLVIADSGEDFRNKLQMFQDKVSHEEIIEATLPLHKEKKSICFVFPGQGQQSFEMGRSLYRDEPVFRKAVDDCDAAYKKITGYSFLHKYNMFIPLEPGKEYNRDSANEILISQPAILFLQIGLLHLVEHWGIKADCVVGHSLGEVAAAYAAGTVTLEAAITVQYHRATQQDRLAGTGSMAAFRVGPEEGEKLCKKTKDLYVACINAHKSVTMAGGKQVIKDLCAAYPDNAKELRVLCAFHTPHMDPIRDDFLKLMEGKLESTKPHRYAMYSTVTGTGKPHEDVTDIKYFWDNIREPVHFLEAVQGVMRDYENVVFVELAGSATLLSSIRAIAKEEEIQPAGMVSCGQRGRDDRISGLRALSTLYGMGIEVNWTNLHGNCAHWMQLPKYAWQHQTFINEAEDFRKRRLDIDDLTIRGNNGTILMKTMHYYKDSIINGNIVCPRSAFLEFAMEMEFNDEALPVLRDVEFNPEFLVLPEEADLNGVAPERKRLSIAKEHSKNGRKVSVMCDDIEYAQMEIYNQEKKAPAEKVDISRIRTRCKKELSGEEFYAKFAEMGVEYEDEVKFRNVKEAYIGDGEALAALRPFVDRHQRLNVISLDAAFTVAMAALDKNTTLLTPKRIESLRMQVPQLPRKTDLMVHAQLTSANAWGITSDLVITDMQGNVFVEVKGFRAENTTTTKTNVDLKSCLYTTEWQPVEACMPPTSMMTEYFKTQNLDKIYPEEMTKIRNTEKLSTRLRELTTAYAKKAVTAVDASEVHPKNERYYKRLLQVAEAVPTKLKSEELPAVVASMIKENPEHSQELDMILRMGEIMPETLKDPKVALAELFQEDMMKAYFLDSIGTRIYYKTIADTVRLAVLEAKKKKQIVRIAEVGGRLGGLSEYILTAIEDLLQDGSVQFTFTDINIAFFHMVEERLQRFPNVQYQQLDVERDIVTQGLVPNAYDLVVALDTLHCTKDSAEACSIIRDMLCKDGWLMVMEATNNFNLSEIVFGAFDLCWIYDDMRKDKCWMGQNGWVDVMERSGFSDVVAVSTPNEFYHSVIIGRKTKMELEYPALQAREKGEEEMHVEPSEKPMWVLVQMDDVSLPSKVLIKLKLSTNTKVVNVEEFHKMANALTSYDGVLNIAFFWNEKDTDLSDTLSIIKVCQELGERPSSKLWAITEGAVTDHKVNASVALGFLRSAMSAVTNMSVVIVDLEKASLPDQMQSIKSVFNCHTHNNTELAIHKGTIYVPRVISRPNLLSGENSSATAAWRIEAGSSKDYFNEFDFHQVNVSALRDYEVRVKVEAIGVSTEEIQKVLDLSRSDALQVGKVCAGVVQAVGPAVTNLKVTDEVVVFVEGCMASEIDVSTEVVFKRPHNLSSTSAAASGAAYSQAYHAIVDRANLMSGDTLLIVEASENSGLAAIALANKIGANIICSASTEQKRKFLEKVYGLSNILDATSDSFSQNVMSMTSDRGVDVVFNAANGRQMMETSMRCLATDGHFCQMTKTSFKNSEVALEALQNNCSLHSINLDTLIEKPTRFRAVVQDAMAMLEKGQVKPLASRTHPIQSFKQVFSSMQEEIPSGPLVFEVARNFAPDTIEPALQTFKSDALYVITGATGGVGNEMVRWMTERGARHMVSLSSQGCHTWFHTDLQNYLKTFGAQLTDIKVDMCNEQSVKQTFDSLNKNGFPPLKGIFHLAGVHSQDQMEDLTSYTLMKSVHTKTKSAQLISQILNDMPDVKLDHFVLMSSSKAIWGPPTLSGLCAASSGLDALAMSRKQQGLPALSVQAGWIRGAGLLEDREVAEGIKPYTKGTSLHIREFLALLQKVLSKKDLPAVVAITNEVRPLY